MKRVVEDVTAIESQVGTLYDDVETQVDRSSDSSRKTHRLFINNDNNNKKNCRLYSIAGEIDRFVYLIKYLMVV